MFKSVSNGTGAITYEGGTFFNLNDNLRINKSGVLNPTLTLNNGSSLGTIQYDGTLIECNKSL